MAMASDERAPGVSAALRKRMAAALDAGDDVAHHLPTTDVIIDFSSHLATPALLDLAVTHRKPIVIGTTGHSADEKAHLMKIAGKVPCVWAGKASPHAPESRDHSSRHDGPATIGLPRVDAGNAHELATAAQRQQPADSRHDVRPRKTFLCLHREERSTAKLGQSLVPAHGR